MEPNETNNSNNTSTTKTTGRNVGIGIVIVALLALIGITIASKKSATTDTAAIPADTTSTSTATALPSNTSNSSEQTATTNSSSTYKDGTYSAVGSYISPGGADQLSVSVTLKNDIITDATVIAMPGDSESQHYQNLFISGYKQYVIGQDITKLNVTKVSGSSLTSQGFNDAIAKIEAEAKA